MSKWSPLPVIREHARAVRRAAAEAIRAAAPRAPHRDGSRAPGAIGGSFVSSILSADFAAEKPWGVVLQWSKLGQKFLWFVNGTSRQRARPVPMRPDVSRLIDDLRRDAVSHYEARAAGRRAPVRRRSA